MSELAIAGRVHAHATFTSSGPPPIFIVAVEILDGSVEVGHYVNIPLNPSVAISVRILAIAPFANDLGIELMGLVLDCDASGRTLIEKINMHGESLTVTEKGQD